MRAVVGGMLAAVPVPQLGEGPGFYSPSGGSIVMFVVAVLAIVLFVFNSLASNALAKLGISPLPRVLISAGVMVGAVLLCALISSNDQNAYKERVAAHGAELWQVHLDTSATLEAYFGVDLDEYAIPLKENWAPRSIDVIHPDGREETCLVGTDTGFYEIRCGGDEWDEAVPLVPVNGAAS